MNKVKRDLLGALIAFIGTSFHWIIDDKPKMRDRQATHQSPVSSPDTSVSKVDGPRALADSLPKPAIHQTYPVLAREPKKPANPDSLGKPESKIGL